jgi:hypothetical protein
VERRLKEMENRSRLAASSSSVSESYTATDAAHLRHQPEPPPAPGFSLPTWPSLADDDASAFAAAHDHSGDSHYANVLHYPCLLFCGLSYRIRCRSRAVTTTSRGKRASR